MSCPLDCEYLKEARLHEPEVKLERSQIPNLDVEVTESFLERNEPLLTVLSVSLLQGALSVPNVVDSDVREALEAIIKTYRTRQSGLIYESRPANPIAGAMQQHLQTTIAQLQERMQQQTGMNTIRDADILGVLVFLQRFELQWANGRRRGRSFISLLLNRFSTGAPQAEQQQQAPSIIQP